MASVFTEIIAIYFTLDSRLKIMKFIRKESIFFKQLKLAFHNDVICKHKIMNNSKSNTQKITFIPYTTQSPFCINI